MNTIQVTKENNYAIVQLDRGSANPINIEMLQELNTCFQGLAKDDSIDGAVLTGKERFFSAGLDVIELYAYDNDQVAELFESLFNAIKTMISFPKPLVASITGHSPAGGCVLALCCDYRIMADGKYRIGLNEVPVGIVMPKFIYHLYESVIGSKLAMQFILEGKLLAINEALDTGLVDVSVPEDQVLATALEQLEKYLSLNKRTWQYSKLNMRQPLLAHFSHFDEDLKAEILGHWWSDDTRKILGGLVAHLTKK
ncbi:MAG: 3,2-trans-enoyl-CoA isomerase [Chitinophagales bacterium]|jgi:3,2-trans-enoyl-CoA isomerase